MKTKTISSFFLTSLLIAPLGLNVAFASEHHKKAHHQGWIHIKHTDSDKTSDIFNSGNSKTAYTGANYQFNRYDQRNYGIKAVGAIPGLSRFGFGSQSGSDSGPGIGSGQLNDDIHNVNGNVGIFGNYMGMMDGMGMGMDMGMGAGSSGTTATSSDSSTSDSSSSASDSSN